MSLGVTVGSSSRQLVHEAQWAATKSRGRFIKHTLRAHSLYGERREEGREEGEYMEVQGREGRVRRENQKDEGRS